MRRLAINFKMSTRQDAGATRDNRDKRLRKAATIYSGMWLKKKKNYHD